MTILKPLNDTTMLTHCEQYFIQTLHQKVNSFPSNPPAKKTLLQLAIDPAYTPLEETS